MIQFTAVIKKFDEQGEKTGWTYIDIPEEIAGQLKPGNKKSFRVKGTLDAYHIKEMALLPMGGGDFIMPINGTIRKGIGKGRGSIVSIALEIDHTPVQICPELLQCLQDEPVALEFFNTLPLSHRKYFSNWIESAKTIETKTKRIAQTVTACLRKQHYGEMIRSLKADKNMMG